MTADMAPHWSPWQRFIARILPWFDPVRQDQADRRIDDLVNRVSRLESIRVAYKEVGDRPYTERRKVPR